MPAGKSSYLQLINTNTQGPRCDVTPLFADYAAFSQLIHDLSLPLKQLDFDYVAGIDALGFILGTAMALHFKVGFLAIRKGDKLPVKTDQVCFVDYTGQKKSLELQHGAIKPGARVVLIDEWIETGSQIRAALGLVERQGGIVAGIATINIDENENTRSLLKEYACHAIWRDGNPAR
jgi:adenine phosphoribosyltransferase